MEPLTYASNPAEIPDGTLCELILGAVDRFGTAPALREFVGAGDELRDITYDEMFRLACQGAAALRDAGLKPGDRAAILSENRTEWALADQACLFAGVVDIPVYDTLIAEQVAYIFDDSGASLVFVSTRGQMEKALEAASSLDREMAVVVFEPGSGPLPDGVVAWSEFLAGSDPWDRERVEQEMADIRPESLATVLYTSGTTGEPKGVMLTHRNIYSNVVASGRVLHIRDDDVTVSFLPLSHIFQRMVDYLLLSQGCVLARAHEIRTVGADLALVRPTVQVAVPRVYEKVYNGVMERAQGIKRTLLVWAKGVGRRWAEARLEGRSTGAVTRFQYRLADRLVFSKIRAAVGGRVRFFISGSAPLNPDLALFFYSAGMVILEGYGLTETSPVTNVNPMEKVRIGSVGPPIPGTEIRIIPIPGWDLKPGEGEILVRGPQVMKGYYGSPDATAEVLDPDGWFHTGDIGILDPDGYLRITGRKKNIIVTAGGKNISPEHIEKPLKTNPFVEQVVMVGDKRKFGSLVGVPSFTTIRSWAAEAGVSLPDDPAAVLAHPRVQELLEREILGGLPALTRYERPKKLLLLDREFSIEDGTLTPTQKVVRHRVQERLKGAIDQLYLDENEDRTVFVA
ncbi:MAG: long-chain fatty acid--CoA ligase [Gemmatimonadota bacterium]